MAHRVTAPAMQRARRMLDQRITPFVTSGAINFTVTSTEEWFESPGYEAAVASPVTPFVIGSYFTAIHFSKFRVLKESFNLKVNKETMT